MQQTECFFRTVKQIITFYTLIFTAYVLDCRKEDGNFHTEW